MIPTTLEHLTYPLLSVRVSALLANIRLECKLLKVTNTLAYYNTDINTAVKSL